MKITMMHKKKRNDLPAFVVGDMRIEKVIRLFRERCTNAGIFSELKRRQGHETKRERRRYKEYRSKLRVKRNKQGHN